MESRKHRNSKPDTDDEEVVIFENKMHGVSLDGDEEKGMGPVPEGIVFGDKSRNTEFKRESIKEVDKLLSTDKSALGNIRWCVFNGLYYTILRASNFIVYCNIAMLANLTFIGTYERTKDLNYAFAIGITVPCIFGFVVSLFEYVRSVNSEIDNYSDNLTIRFITAAALNKCDVFVFTIHIVLFACLLISCIAIGVKCDTPGTPCHDLYATLLGEPNR